MKHVKTIREKERGVLNADVTCMYMRYNYLSNMKTTQLYTRIITGFSFGIREIV